jgi:2-polyprenyl-6-methoxyphenol hydroxylase-like FAD-dependent oxidoreductase
VNDADVIVAGAGPVGLFLAVQLQARGHSCLVIDRNAAPSAQSRALAIMPRTLELFERAGVVERFLKCAHRLRAVRFVTERGSALVRFDTLPVRYPFIAILPQWKTEALLRDRLAEQQVIVRYGNALAHFRSHSGGVECTVANDEGEYTLRAGFLAGCDGVYSTVRSQLHIPFRGRTYTQRALLADLEVETALPPDEAVVHVSSAGVVTLFPMSEHQRRLVVISPKEVLPQEASRMWLQRRAEQAGLGVRLTAEPSWTSTFRVHRRVADAMYCGNVVLAGDAVHAHSPVGGQGMNTGLADAWSLASALSVSLTGGSAQNALRQYQRRRLRIAHKVVRTTDVLMHALVNPHPVVAGIRKRFTPAIIGLPIVQRRALRSLLTA